MSLGERLKNERIRLTMTIPEFAAAAGVGKNTVIDWQNNASSPPASKLVALAAVGVDCAYVISGIPAKGHRRLAAVGEARNILVMAGAPLDVAGALLPTLVELLSRFEDELSDDQRELLGHYSRCSDDDKDQIRKLAARLAPAMAAKASRKPLEPAETHHVRQVFKSRVGQVAGHDIVNERKKPR